MSDQFDDINPLLRAQYRESHKRHEQALNKQLLRETGKTLEQHRDLMFKNITCPTCGRKS